MTRSLKTGRKAPASGVVKNAVAFLHGFGADGADLLGLADPLAPHLPDTLFVAPDAPDPCSVNPGGRQWFPIPWMDGSSAEDVAAALARSAADLDAWIDDLLVAEGLSPAHLALVGFSQGTMMSLHVAPRRAEPLAGIVGFSGRLVAPERLEGELRARPPVLLLHGDADDLVPFQSMHEAGDALVRAGFDVYAHVMKGTPHAISPDGLSVALSFLRDRLPA